MLYKICQLALGNPHGFLVFALNTKSVMLNASATITDKWIPSTIQPENLSLKKSVFWVALKGYGDLPE